MRNLEILLQGIVQSKVRCRGDLLGRFALGLFSDQRLVNVGDDSAAGNGSLDEGVQLLVTTNGELQVTRSDTFHLQVLGCVAGQLEDLRRKSLC